jgi:aminoglycoside 3-N-acetyltransferase
MEENKITKETLLADLKLLGVQHGDVLFITLDLMNIGYFAENRKTTVDTLLDILITAVGDKGCIILPSYTETFLRFKKKSTIIYTKASNSLAGSFVNTLLKRFDVKRSTHPTHSYIGFGYNVERYLNAHTEKSLSYSIIGDIIKANGKLLMLGTIDNKNAPPALHYVQEVLGYTKKGPLRGLFQTYYYEDKTLKLFTVNDYGGCTRGAYNLYGALIINEAIKFSKVGMAICAIMDGRKSYEVLLDIMKNNSEIINCDNLLCIQCHGNFYRHGLRTIPFYFRKVLSLINK